jgi:hypothetical protein
MNPNNFLRNSEELESSNECKERDADKFHRTRSDDRERAKVSDLPQGFGNGSIPFAGTESALYERHLIFDRAIDPKIATARERFEAFSRSVRDILAER